MTVALPGTASTKSATRCLNSLFFHKNIESHLLKYIPGSVRPENTLMICHGATSHVAVSLKACTKSSKIITCIYVLPARSRHLLQPINFVGFFQTIKTAYSNECQLLLPTHVGIQFSRYDICILVCKIYSEALTPSNITSAFHKNGKWTLRKVVISDEKRAPNINTTIFPETDTNVK